MKAQIYFYTNSAVTVHFDPEKVLKEELIQIAAEGVVPYDHPAFQLVENDDWDVDESAGAEVTYGESETIVEPVLSKVEQARQVLREAGYFSLGFNIVDIMHRHTDIDEEEARHIAETIERMVESDNGINWDSIDSNVDEFRESRHRELFREMTNYIGESCKELWWKDNFAHFKNLLTSCVHYIGLGFHPDTKFENYIDGEGKNIFTEKQSRHLNFLMGYHFENSTDGFDPYAYCLELMSSKNIQK